MKSFKPKDIIAGLVIIGFFATQFLGLNGTIDAALFLILGYYFVKRTNGSDNGE